jgi:hypothetical protein
MEPGDPPLIPATMLYQFLIDCHRLDPEPAGSKPVELDESFALPAFGELDGARTFAEFRAAWSVSGLWFDLRVEGKQQALWCRPTQVLESDGLSLWIDTRDTRNIHRASRYCHWLVCLPAGGGRSRNEPLTSMLKINRAREFPRTFSSFRMSCVAKVRSDGYSMAIHLPGSSLEGWNPSEHPRIGFSYLVADRELGQQSLSIGSGFPIAEDPTLWQTLRLVD